MASWKERGEVPDSEDEDEDDSQGFSNEGYGQGHLQEPRGAQRMPTGGKSRDGDIGIGQYQDQLSRDVSDVAGPLPLQSTSKQPSLSPRVFKNPPALLDRNRWPELWEQSSQNLLPVDDDISHSYVRFSSSLSSQKTPSSQNHQLDDSTAVAGREAYSQICEDDLVIQNESRNWQNGTELKILDECAEFPSSKRRSLRQRNPIQLHPYALEGEKYRRILMARGMRPLRLAQVQEDSREVARDHSSPDSDFEVGNESQVLNAEDGLPQSQSSQSSTAVGLPAMTSSERPSTQSGDEDDEFPNVDQLLDRSNEHFLQPGPKRRKTTYGSRYTSLIAPEPSLPRTAPKHGISSKETEILDIPPSPPATSSPVPAFHVPFSDWRSKYVKSNLASSRAVSLEYAGSEAGAFTGNLPTPTTNLVNHTIDLTAEDHQNGNSIASDSECSNASRSSDEDQFMQVRRVGKRIRGVLPASWLRLDQQTGQHRDAKVNYREHRSVSPIRAALSRRGVALPKDLNDENSPITARNNSDSHFILSDSEEEDEPSLSRLAEESATRFFPDSALSQTDIGSMMEDDRVDAMLPSRRRQTKLLPGASHGKKRTVTTSLFTKRHSGPRFQPKITDHLQETQSSLSTRQSRKRHHIHISSLAKAPKITQSKRHSQTLTPKLSILDVVHSYANNPQRMPVFIRIAARNARSRKGFGRHSPTRKFIKLGNRSDTQDAQSVLRDWRDGKLSPRVGVTDLNQPLDVRPPLSDISDNIPNAVVSAVRDDCNPQIEAAHFPALPRKVVVSRSFAQTRQAGSSRTRLSVPGRKASTTQLKASKLGVGAPKKTISISRPAQLEMSVREYSTRHPDVAFCSTKRVLDTLYRKAYKENKARGGGQIGRLYEDESPPLHTDTPIPIEDRHGRKTSSTRKNDPAKPARPRKRHPQHVDANAVMFRQPSEPLILDFLPSSPETVGKYGHDGKLLGLGKFGTSYTSHFDIFPLEPGIFFDKSTFIGSGRLSKALQTTSDQYYSDQRGHIEIRLGQKELQWGPWNDTVSSEVGMCFDWIIEQLEGFMTENSDVDDRALVKCATHIVDYVQNNLSFQVSSDQDKCMLRVIEVLSCFAEQAEMLALQAGSGSDKLCIFIELSCRVLVLCFQFLRIVQSDSRELATEQRLATLLRKVAVLTVSLLHSLSLTPIRNLFDDLQYLAYRGAGIQCDRYAAQAWVITMHIMYSARIPRVTFWDLVNSQIIKDDEAQLNDARVLERMWYDMFSLLPLTDFDMNGVLNSGVRLLNTFENWALPQRMAKKIFELYNSKSRQSPSFNDYCRAIFNRCSHLMLTWGWRRHGIIVGTLFDFFATRKLDHLRNEEVYRSPRFLEELDQDPNLGIDPEDRCFHILLKIIAISIKQMREAGDTRGIRNLVTRVLPNHDRQYPKEKTIRQRDLASLRNHHDLLCTLFWVAPLDLRPPITLIRELVNPGSSHQEAYLINLRSWENLTRFILAFTPTPAAYLPFAKWQSESFIQLLAQYESAEQDIERQLQRLPATAKQIISQHEITTTVRENRKQTAMDLAQNLRAMKRSVDRTRYIDLFKNMIFNDQGHHALTSALGLFKHRYPCDVPVVEVALDIIRAYSQRLIELSRGSDVQTQHGIDSQEYGSDVFGDVHVDIIEYTGALNGEVMAGVRDVLRASLASGVSIKTSFIFKVIETWAHIAASLILAKTHDLSDFFSESGPLNELDLDSASLNIRQYAPRFLGLLAQLTGNHLQLNITGRDQLSDWLCMSIKPVEFLHAEPELLSLFSKHEAVIEHALAKFLRRRPTSAKCVDSVAGFRNCRADLVHDILREMRLVLKDQPQEKIRYQGIVQRMLTHMKLDLGAMHPPQQKTGRHQVFVKIIHEMLSTFFGELCANDLSDEFFSTDSTYPEHPDVYRKTQRFLPTIRNYGLRLGTTRGKNELNHYFFAVLKQAAVKGNLGEISEILIEALFDKEGNWIDLSHYVLVELAPSFIHAAFMSDQGWLLAEPLLHAAQEHLMDIADCDRSGALGGVSQIMASIVHGIIHLIQQYSCEIVRVPTGLELIYVLLMSTRFMIGAFDWLPFVMETCNIDTHKISDFQTSFYLFACGAKSYLKSPLSTFISSLPRYDDCSPNSDNRQSLVDRYLTAMDGGSTADRAATLYRLAQPFAPEDESIRMVMASIEKLQGKRSLFWLLHDMKGSGFFKGSTQVLEVYPALPTPHFSQVILADYRQNWALCYANRDMEINFGPKKQAVNGITSRGLSLEKIYDPFRKALDEYIFCYEKVKRSLPAGQSAHSNQERGKGLGNLPSENSAVF